MTLRNGGIEVSLLLSYAGEGLDTSVKDRITSATGYIDHEGCFIPGGEEKF